MSKNIFLQNSSNKHFEITVVGGGLTGCLMIYILIQSQIVGKKKICWVKPKENYNFDDRVSFYNTSNYNNLNKFGLLNKLPANEYNIIKNIEILNECQNKPLTFTDTDNLGYILKNKYIQELLLKSSKDVSIIYSKVVKSKVDDYERKLLLESGEEITSNIVLAADGSNSHLRNISSIKYFRHNFKHQALTGHLIMKSDSKNTARQAFLKEGPIGLLPVEYNNNNLINFVWSIKETFANSFTDNNIIKSYLIKRLNELYSKFDIRFTDLNKNHSKYQLDIYKWPLQLVHVPKPFAQRLALIGDAAHSVHPLAGQGFNLSLEDCFDMLEILKESHKKGKDFGDLDNLLKYSKKRNIRTKLIILSTSSIFYSFTKDSKLIKKILSYGMENLENTRFKNIFKSIASG